MREVLENASQIQASDFHFIGNGTTNILFNVDNLEVISCTELDLKILKFAFYPISVESLLKKISDTDEKEITLRMQTLIKKGLLHFEEQFYDRAPLPATSKYITFMINVAQRCNLSCNYCYVNLGHFDYPDKPIAKMSITDAECLVDNIYKQFPGLSIYGYHFYGGEPLLNFDAIKIIVEHAIKKAEASETSADFHITTNGTLVTPEIAEFFDNNNFTVYYSFDTDQKKHDSARPYRDGSGSFNDVSNNLALLKGKIGIHLILSSVIGNNNCLSTAIEKLSEQGANQCKAERARVDEENPSALRDTEEQDYIKDITGLVEHYINNIKRHQKPLDYRLSSKILQLLVKKRRDFFCPAGERMFGVAADGELYPCALHVGRENSKIGHIVNGIEKQAITNFRKRFSAVEQEECKKCWSRSLCGGGCSAMVDRFGHEKCDILRAESEAAIKVFHHFSTNDPLQLLSLVSPKITKWMDSKLNDPNELRPSEPAAELWR